MVFIDKN